MLNDIPKISSYDLLDSHLGWRKLGLSTCAVLGLVLIRGFFFILHPKGGSELSLKQAVFLIFKVRILGIIVACGLFSLTRMSGHCEKLLETHTAGLAVAALKRLAALLQACSGEEWVPQVQHCDLDIDAILGPAG